MPSVTAGKPNNSGFRLQRPPIVEVACGFEFAPLAALDALQLGRIWSEAFSAYPRAVPQAPISEHPSVSLGPPEIRAWYVSEDDNQVVQLQKDRLVFNWRSVEGLGYPRFRSRGDQKGVLTLALESFDRFLSTWHSRGDETVRLKSLSVTKVDLLERGRHWSSIPDLVAWLPALRGFVLGAEDDPQRIDLRFDVRKHGMYQTIVIRAGLVRDEIHQVRVETTASAAFVDDSQSELERLNAAVNQLFKTHLSELALTQLGIETST